MRRLGLLAGVALVCCASLPSGGPPAPNPYQLEPGASASAYVVQFSPPPIYELWWTEVQQCSGIAQPKLALEQLRFYLVGGDSSFRAGDEQVYALYDIRRGNVLIAAPLVMRADIVRHEFLHVLTSPTRNVGHPASVFRGRCDSLVYHAPGT